MTALKTIWALIKNPKNLVIILLSILFILFAWRFYSLQIAWDKEKINQQNEHINLLNKNLKAINNMTEQIKKSNITSTKLSEEIKAMKLTKERCQDEIYYSTAKRIIDDYNNELQ